MSRGSPKLSMWESVCRSADTVQDAQSSASGSGLLEDLAPLPAPVVAALDAKFELGRELGRGVSGVVFLARDRTLDRPVALKVLRDAASERQRARFQREGRLAASLQHPGIVGVLGSGEAGGAPYLAYELVPGARSLAEVIPSSDRATRIGLVRELAVAVGAAHAAGIVHRDVKPANVLVAPDGTVRLTDFGLGSDPQGETLTQTGAMVGTPVFMAPELVRGKHSVVCAATDVWALGVLLYACCVDALPFEGEDMLTLGARICGSEYLPLRELDPDIDPRLVAVVERALRVDPGARYADGDAFAAALAELLATPPAQPSVARALLIGAGLGCLVLLVVIAWSVLNAGPVTPNGPAVSEPDPEAQPEPLAPALPEGAVLKLPVGWATEVEVDMQSSMEFDARNQLSTLEVSSWFRMRWEVTALEGREALVDVSFSQLRFSWDIDSARVPKSGSMGIDPVRFDSQRNRDAEHPLLRMLDKHFSFSLDLGTGRVQRVRGIEAIHDEVFEGLSQREVMMLRVPWLQSSELVRITLDNLLCVYPMSPTSDPEWSLSRRRTRPARGQRLGWGRGGGGLPSVSVGQVVGTCKRDLSEREPTHRLSWKAQGRASSDPTPWTRQGDGKDYEVTADGELSQHGEFLAEDGQPVSASYREDYTFSRHFLAEDEDRTSTQRFEVSASLRFKSR